MVQYTKINVYTFFVPLKTYKTLPVVFSGECIFLEEIMTRKEERELAFTLIFEKIFNDELTVQEIVDAALEAGLIEENMFAISLAQMTSEHTEEFDELISENSIGWRTERLPKVSLSILRLALCEMLYVESIPVKVSANEAVELAKKFGTQEDASFINGILGKVIREKDLK